MKSYKKVVINGKFNGRCGPHQMIEGEEDDRKSISLIVDRGYKKGDIVEEWYSDEGHNWDVDKVVKNGVVIYEINLAEYHKQKQEEHDNFMKQTLKSKGINHPIYNP